MRISQHNYKGNLIFLVRCGADALNAFKCHADAHRFMCREQVAATLDPDAADRYRLGNPVRNLLGECV